MGILLFILCLAAAVQAQPSVVPTFECLGLYHPSSDSSGCAIQYRQKDAPT